MFEMILSIEERRLARDISGWPRVRAAGGASSSWLSLWMCVSLEHLLKTTRETMMQTIAYLHKRYGERRAQTASFPKLSTTFNTDQESGELFQVSEEERLWVILVISGTISPEYFVNKEGGGGEFNHHKQAISPYPSVVCTSWKKSLPNCTKIKTFPKMDGRGWQTDKESAQTNGPEHKHRLCFRRWDEQQSWSVPEFLCAVPL